MGGVRVEDEGDICLKSSALAQSSRRLFLISKSSILACNNFNYHGHFPFFSSLVATPDHVHSLSKLSFTPRPLCTCFEGPFHSRHSFSPPEHSSFFPSTQPAVELVRDSFVSLIRSSCGSERAKRGRVAHVSGGKRRRRERR